MLALLLQNNMAALVMMICVATTISVVARERIKGAGHQRSTHYIKSCFIHDMEKAGWGTKSCAGP